MLALSQYYRYISYSRAERTGSSNNDLEGRGGGTHAADTGCLCETRLRRACHSDSLVRVRRGHRCERRGRRFGAVVNDGGER